ncbi:MAG: NAD-binding protein [Chloroflexi bacterium]|nr:NAD-binding protein [Chloroflexota bacterium]
MTFPFPGLFGPVTPEPPPEPEPYLLHTEFRLGPLALPNRIVMAPMGTGFASPEGLPTPRLIAWYAARAAGGAGLIVVEATQVMREGEPALDSADAAKIRRRLRLATDDAIPAFTRLVGAVHDAGARAAIQMTHTRSGSVDALSGAEIAPVVRAFGEAAGRARAAGFDAVEVQCSYTSLLAALLSPATNRRRDRYGRGPAGRRRALRDVVAAIRATAGDDYPIIVKLSADEYVPRGLTPPQAAEIAKELEGAGAVAIDVIAGAAASDAALRLSCGVGESTLVDLAAAIKQAVDVPVLAGGRMLSSSSAETALREGKADLVAVGRALLADPSWPAKIRVGIEDEVIPCIGCLACFTPEADGGTGCPVNGEAGREYLPPLSYAERPRRIAIRGASLAGLELARVAAARGHTVEIATEGLPFGGLLGLRAGVPGNAEFGRAFLYYGDRLGELGVGIADQIDTGAVVVDCRPRPEIVPAWVAGSGGKSVHVSGDLLTRDLHEFYGLGRRVAVIGPGALAAEVALFLAGWGRRPTVVVPNPPENPFPDVHPMHAARLLERLEGYKVALVAGATVLEWLYDPDRRSKLRITQRGQERTLEPFHSAISAAGWPQIGGQDSHASAAPLWPERAVLPRLPREVKDGTTIVLGDTLYPEPLRDLVGFAHLLGRRL